MNRTKVIKVANGLKILYTVLYILCIVGIALILFSGIILSAMDSAGVWDNQEFLEMVGDFSDIADIELPSLDIMMYGLAISMIGFVVLYILTARFYKYVTTVGEIFDHTVIKKMQTLGILYIVLPPVFGMIGGAIITNFTNFDFELTNSPQLTMGIVYLILTVVFSYGADLKDGKTEESEEESSFSEDEE